MVMSNYFTTFFSYSYKPFGLADSPHPPMSDSTLTWASSIGSGIVNGLARIVFGSLVDKYNFRFLMIIVMVIQLVNSLVCFWAAYNTPSYFFCVVVNYMASGAIFTCFPVGVTSTFGLEHGPTIYVQILFGGFVSAVLNLITTKYILPATSFCFLFYVGSIAQVLVLVLLFFFKEELDVDNLAKFNGVVRVKIAKE